MNRRTNTTEAEPGAGGDGVTGTDSRLTVLTRAVFGDRLGVTLFLGSLAFFALSMRLGVVINDNATVLNALVAVADGHLYLEEKAFGAFLNTPGTVEVGGRVYGRNYGHVFLALPILLALDGLAAVADLRLLLAGGWSLSLLGTAIGIGRVTGHERRAVQIGTVLALVTFGGSVALATALRPRYHPLVALQLVTMVAGALAAVLLYRLVTDIHDRRTGIATGIVTAVAIPVGFWATIPKRHVLIAALAVAAGFLLYRSRTVVRESGDPAPSPDLVRRSGAYVTVGLAAWVAAPEGVILGLAVVVADLSTLRRVRLREFAVLAVVSVLAFLPFFLTNLAISGNPIAAPRYLPGYEPVAAPPAGAGSGADSGGGFLDFVEIPVLIASQFFEGASVVLLEPERVWKTFVRSGYTVRTPPEVPEGEQVYGINLSVLESGPVFGGLAGLVVLAGRRTNRALRSRWSDGSISHESVSAEAARVCDRFVLAYALLLTLAYMPRLPLYATITVRYLVPMYPLLVYAVARLPAARRAIGHRWRWAAWTYAGTVLVGGQLLLAGTRLFSSGVGESMQTHAVVNLAVAALLAGWAVAATLAARSEGPNGYETVGAVLLGLAAAAGTVLVLLASVAYFPVGEFLLPLVPAL